MALALAHTHMASLMLSHALHGVFLSRAESCQDWPLANPAHAGEPTTPGGTAPLRRCVLHRYAGDRWRPRRGVENPGGIWALTHTDTLSRSAAPTAMRVVSSRSGSARLYR